MCQFLTTNLSYISLTFSKSCSVWFSHRIPSTSWSAKLLLTIPWNRCSREDIDQVTMTGLNKSCSSRINQMQVINMWTLLIYTFSSHLPFSLSFISLSCSASNYFESKFLWRKHEGKEVERVEFTLQDTVNYRKNLDGVKIFVNSLSLRVIETFL